MNPPPSPTELALMHVAHALADPVRLDILLLLSTGEHMVTQIYQSLDYSQPQVSKHLRTLRDAEAVTWRRESNRKYYSLTPAYQPIIRGIGAIIVAAGD